MKTALLIATLIVVTLAGCGGGSTVVPHNYAIVVSTLSNGAWVPLERNPNWGMVLGHIGIYRFAVADLDDAVKTQGGIDWEITVRDANGKAPTPSEMMLYDLSELQTFTITATHRDRPGVVLIEKLWLIPDGDGKLP